MKYNKTFDSATHVRIGEVRFSYPALFEPKEDNNGNKKYSCQILIPKENEEAVKLIKAAIVEAKRTKFGDKGAKGQFHNPLRDGDEEHGDEDVYAGMYFLNASNKYAPKVQVLENDPDFGELQRRNADPEDVYPGAWGVVCLDFFGYDTSGNKGVGVSLGNIIKTKDDARLGGGGQSADDSFGDID